MKIRFKNMYISVYIQCMHKQHSNYAAEKVKSKHPFSIHLCLPCSAFFHFHFKTNVIIKSIDGSLKEKSVCENGDFTWQST